MEIEQKQYTPKQYIVCYLDFLGIREKLFSNMDYHCSEITPEQQTTINRFSELISNSLDILDFAIKLFSNPSYDLIEKFCPTSLQETITEDCKKEVLQRLQGVKYSIQFFSDSLLIYLPYDNNNRYEYMDSFSFLLSLYSNIFLSTVDQGILIRGALTIGTAWEIRSNYLFGPAVHEAYLLESTVAKHPRIVLSPSLIQLVEKTKQDAKRNNRAIDESLLSTAIVSDYDGVSMLNYLSVSNFSLSRNLLDINSYISMIVKAFDAIKKNYISYCAHKETVSTEKFSHEAELARRYYAMLLFFKRNEKPINDYLVSIGEKPICFDFDLL